MIFTKVPYSTLNSRQKEIYNFQKVAARLAEYGFNCIPLSDDWEGADFIALHADGSTVLRVQLKGRMALAKKYIGKEIYIAFRRADVFYVYPHDELLDLIRQNGAINEEGAHWSSKGTWDWPSPPSWAMSFLSQYRV